MAKLDSSMKFAIGLIGFVCLFSFMGNRIHAQPADSALSNPFYVLPEVQDFSQNPPLLKRVISSPHGYFRFINIQFSQEVCHRFSNTLAGTPSLNLHGDAHIEQYAVTDMGAWPDRFRRLVHGAGHHRLDALRRLAQSRLSRARLARAIRSALRSIFKGLSRRAEKSGDGSARTFGRAADEVEIQDRSEKLFQVDRF